MSNVFGKMLVAFAKSEPCAEDVHVPTTGRKKPRMVAALEKFGYISDAEWNEQQYRRKLEMMDSRRSMMPLPYHAGFLESLRPDQIPRFLGCLTNPEACRDKEVKISRLMAIQNRVDTDKVVALALNPSATGNKPMVVKHNGVLYIADGHHRVVGAWLRGDETIQTKYKNLEPITNMMKGGWSVRCDITKTDDEQRMVYGWASVIEDEKGNPIVDRQNDVILLKDLMNAAHGYMLGSREAGEMHARMGTGKVVESLVVTPDIRKALGMPEGPVGWFIGMKITDDAVWAKAKSGEYPAFSIGGSASPMKV